jgi:hypothetical protein
MSAKSRRLKPRRNTASTSRGSQRHGSVVSRVNAPLTVDTASNADKLQTDVMNNLRRGPWMTAAAAIVMASSFVDHGKWIYAWTMDAPPGWAKTAFVWLGLLATVTFVHAAITVQHAAITVRSADGRRATKTPRVALPELYKVAGGATAFGALAGTLLSFVYAGSMPRDYKVDRSGQRPGHSRKCGRFGRGLALFRLCHLGICSSPH